MRRELGAFLRARREQADPLAYGFAVSGRRRTCGLRREELAQLVDVGITWYTWLEQGRPVQPSTALLLRIANALALNDDDRRYLFELARPANDVTEGHTRPDDLVLQRLVDGFTAGPAFVRNTRYELLVCNRAMIDLYELKPDDEGLKRNLLWRIFTDPRAREIHAHWSLVADNVIGAFRSSYARHRGEDGFESLLAALLAESPEFAERWRRYHVWTPAPHAVRLAWLPTAVIEWRGGARGERQVDVDISYFDVVGGADRVLVAFTPRD